MISAPGAPNDRTQWLTYSTSTHCLCLPVTAFTRTTHINTDFSFSHFCHILKLCSLSAQRWTSGMMCHAVKSWTDSRRCLEFPWIGQTIKPALYFARTGQEVMCVYCFTHMVKSKDACVCLFFSDVTFLCCSKMIASRAFLAPENMSVLSNVLLK